MLQNEELPASAAHLVTYDRRDLVRNWLVTLVLTAEEGSV
jgi:hypothetical protein